MAVVNRAGVLALTPVKASLGTAKLKLSCATTIRLGTKTMIMPVWLAVATRTTFRVTTLLEPEPSVVPVALALLEVDPLIFPVPLVLIKALLPMELPDVLVLFELPALPDPPVLIVLLDVPESLVLPPAVPPAFEGVCEGSTGVGFVGKGGTTTV